jgi:TolB-like protein
MRYLFEDHALDLDRCELRRGEQLVPLAPQVFDLLAYLIRNRGRVVSKDDLFAAIWNGRFVSESALTTRINAARGAIGDSGEEQRLIRTVPRRGFRFVGAVREEEPGDAAEAAPAPALPDRPSLAVLPFTGMGGGDPEQEHLGGGMAEEIITALSRCGGLFVIARNSSFAYRGTAVDVRRVGRELGVRYVLEGSVRRAGDRLRVTAQLVEAASATQIWAERFEGDMRGVFDLQDRIAESVVAAIEPRLQLAEIARSRRKVAPDLDAYDLLLRAQALEHEFTEASLAAALDCLERALAIDPSYAPALALAGYCHAERFNQGWARSLDAEAAEGLRLAERAVELGKDDATVLWMAGFAVRALGADPHRARELLRRSLQINPNSAIALTTAAWNEAMLANPDEALAMLARAERLSPRDPKAWYMASAAALAHFAAGRFEQAAGRARAALAHNPRFTRTLRVLAASLAKLGRTEEAASVMRELLRLEPHLTVAELRWRLRHMHEDVLRPFVEGLSAAGLPD